MNEGYLLGASLKKKTLFGVAFSFFVLQIVFASQVFASTPNPNNLSKNQRFAQSISSVRLSVKDNLAIPVTGVSLNKSDLTLNEGSSETLIASLIPSNATNQTVYWDSSNTAVAKVDLHKGRVVALKAGTATISVFTEDGNMSEVCNVTVINPDIVTFNDKNLESLVRNNPDLNQPTGDLLKKDLKKIKNLNASNKLISDLNGIENLTNLENLNLSSNPICDISNLKGLTKLKYLHLDNNQIDDFDVLKSLTRLTTLTLSGCQINDLSILNGLTKLTNLNLKDNQIDDITALKKFTKLEYLYLDQNQISNINPLRVLTKLKKLYLSQNPIGDAEKRSLRNSIPKCRIYY